MLDKILKMDKKLLLSIIVAGLLFLVAIVNGVMGGSSSFGNITGSKVDASKKMETTVETTTGQGNTITKSSDTLSNGAIKLGNVGSVGGDLDLSKHTNTNSGK